MYNTVVRSRSASLSIEKFFSGEFTLERSFFLLNIIVIIEIMESNQKKNIFLVGTICVLAVLAVTMMIGTKNQWWGNPYSPKKVDQGNFRSI